MAGFKHDARFDFPNHARNQYKFAKAVVSGDFSSVNYDVGEVRIFFLKGIEEWIFPFVDEGEVCFFDVRIGERVGLLQKLQYQILGVRMDTGFLVIDGIGED